MILRLFCIVMCFSLAASSSGYADSSAMSHRESLVRIRGGATQAGAKPMQQTKGNNNSGASNQHADHTNGVKYHPATVEKLDRTKILHRLVIWILGELISIRNNVLTIVHFLSQRALIEDPLVDLVIGLVAASVALYEICRDVTSLSGHHGVFLLTFMHALKAFVTVVVESRRGLKGYHARFHN